MSLRRTGWRRWAPASVVALAVTGIVMPGTAGAEPVAAPGFSSFSARFDGRLAGGVWSLTTHDTDAANGTALLASGTVPADGAVTATVPSVALAASDTGQFAIRAARVLQDSKADVGVRTVGVSLDQLGSDLRLDLGTAVTRQVVTYPSVEEAAAAATCGSACTADGSVPELPKPSRAKAAAAPKRLQPGQRGVGRPETPVDEAGSLACVAEDTCGLAVEVPTRNPGECSFFGALTVCTIAARDIAGVPAFRGWSGRYGGMTNTFSVEVGTSQKWDNGLRLKAGPFEVSGSTTRTVGAGGSDTWPLRGDCWSDSQYNQPPCSFPGHESKWGRDTWRWERNINTVCSSAGFFPVCNSWEDENLFNKQYDGGTENGNVTSANYNQRPSSIRAGTYGSWSEHLPGASRKTWMENAVSYGAAASISINFPESMGSATFSSSMTHQNTTKVTNDYAFRTGLPWFSSAPGWPAGTGKWYRYDFGTSWQYEFFACEWAPGWTGGSCWDNGS